MTQGPVTGPETPRSGESAGGRPGAQPAPRAASSSPSTASTPGAALEERVVETKVLHRGHYLEYRIVTIERPDGSRGERQIVGHPGAVAIVALDDADRVVLVRQWRVATGRALLEIPAGTLNIGADGAVEDPDVAAPRELEEETGFRAGRWEKLATFWTAPGFATELMHLYLATDLRPATEDRARPEEDERLELERLPWREAVAAAERGEIADAKSLVGLDRLAKRMDGRPAVEPGAAGHVMARFRMSMRDAIGATAALTRASLATQLVGLGFVGLSVVGAVLGADPIPNLVTFLFGASLVTGWVCVPFVWYQARKRPELFRSESSFSADAAGVRYTSPFGNSASPWSAFKRVRSRSGYLFLDTGVGASLYVPLRAFDAVEQEKLDRLLRAAGVAVG